MKMKGEGKKVITMFGYALQVLHLFVYVAERKREGDREGEMRDCDRERE